jgi:hypothetical protein
MNEKPQQKKTYLKPAVRRVDLSLSEVALGSQCHLTGVDPELSPCFQGAPTDCEYVSPP